MSDAKPILGEDTIFGRLYYQDADYAALEAECAMLREALAELLSCPFHVENATVPRAGIEAAPEQVVLNASVGLMRWRKARAALAASTGQEVEHDA